MRIALILPLVALMGAGIANAATPAADPMAKTATKAEKMGSDHKPAKASHKKAAAKTEAAKTEATKAEKPKA
ncbi:MAG: hypothetical protein CFE37_02450 [Alphaproteobacteria bacterium PA4]|nr:MAG: hypothetical protein CFE37_02450 [Alphaproteobacteria bacterium PA4]